MPAKITERASDIGAIDQWDGGLSWIAHPDEIMERASHGLRTPEGVWLVDPVDGGNLDAILEDIGEVAGVVVLSNHHSRDAEDIASRHGVPVSLPEAMNEVPIDDTADVARIDDHLPGTEYEVLTVAQSTNWYEFGLYDGETLVVPESVGTAEYIRVGAEPLGVMTMRRLTPPRASLSGIEPERILVGHGPGLFQDASAALAAALKTSRRRLPRALLENGPSQLRTVTAAIRS